MHTDNKDIQLLVNEVVSLSVSIFGKRLQAVYLMGSLARGGFSEFCSDIDMGILLKSPLEVKDEERINQIHTKAIGKFNLQNNLSLFWGSTRSINGDEKYGRFPPFDILDLIDHALLLHGNDVRKFMNRPSKKDLEVIGGEFALRRLGNEDMIAEFKNPRSMIDKGNPYISKMVLWPTRFIYLAKTGKVAGNDESKENYINSFTGNDALLVKIGYKLRQGEDIDSKDVLKALDEGFIKLYYRFIDVYLECFKKYEQRDLYTEFTKWKERLNG